MKITTIVALMDGTRTVDEICADFAKTHPGVGDDSVRDVIADLVESGIQVLFLVTFIRTRRSRS
ncbi:hypothetical protein [Streptosporangium sandarakinum]|uniref:hypothetical protein n=1 Tax=Streptosporangium sandarakinum TaxID=1260955 RepID=UPI0037162BD5